MTRAGEQFTCDWLNGRLQPANPALYDAESEDGPQSAIDDAVRAAQWVSTPVHYLRRDDPIAPRRPLRTRTVPIVYAGAPFGDLHLHWPGTRDEEAAFLALSSEIAQQAAFFCQAL
ncbi:hypothetical protein VZ95_18650 [Elstera litoralis]|uniref:Uncharacterized protein n=1 Tax=Elstera litoralis TaxID=552518 RepID=A0A0F3IRU1_9PROT|nr:hypothetical protein [Elstera litoralis]KJV08304.1 hypothetical protein VZ95_18650 [Elstera litoralis]